MKHEESVIVIDLE